MFFININEILVITSVLPIARIHFHTKINELLYGGRDAVHYSSYDVDSYVDGGVFIIN